MAPPPRGSGENLALKAEVDDPRAQVAWFRKQEFGRQPEFRLHRRFHRQFSLRPE